MDEEKQYKLAVEYLRQPREQAPHGLRSTPWVRNLLMGFIEFLEENRGVDSYFKTDKLEVEIRPEANKNLFKFIAHNGQVIEGVATELELTREPPR